jgi:hypothetical protein
MSRPKQPSPRQIQERTQATTGVRLVIILEQLKAIKVVPAALKHPSIDWMVAEVENWHRKNMELGSELNEVEQR